ncbi:hypothetical protein HPB47_018533 [Ixodes persulcatus]|uniref:Uncharacterized protein n=1 Tax=Ixodes persulcatus TaxID=34615 RepID=A0AC60QNZ9_IXOPE|nr:hypothetical protein HPB47_018533 [Ixodes persulcatus]
METIPSLCGVEAQERISGITRKWRQTKTRTERTRPEVPPPASSLGILSRQCSWLLDRLTSTSGRRDYSQREELSSSPLPGVAASSRRRATRSVHNGSDSRAPTLNGKAKPRRVDKKGGKGKDVALVKAHRNIALWDKRTRALEKYRQGKQKKHLDKVNRLTEEASKYANVLSIDRWLGYCESFDEKTNLRDVWKTFKSMSGKKKGASPVPVIALLSNEKTEEILNKLGDIFFPQPPTKPEAIIYHPTHSGPADKPEDLPFTEWELGAAIQQCRSKSAPGEDGITVPMLRNAPLATRLVILKRFNEIWESGQLPEEWKLSLVTPIPKPGKPATDPKNKGLDTIEEYLADVGMFPSPEKTKYTIYGRDQDNKTLGLTFAGDPIQKADSVKILGINFGYKPRISKAWLAEISKKWKQGINLVRRISTKMGGAGEKTAKKLVTAVLVSKIAYAARFYRLTKTHLSRFKSMLNGARKTILGLPRHTSAEEVNKCIFLPELTDLMNQQKEAQLSRLQHTTEGRKIAKYKGIEIQEDVPI